MGTTLRPRPMYQVIRNGENGAIVSVVERNGATIAVWHLLRRAADDALARHVGEQIIAYTALYWA